MTTIATAAVGRAGDRAVVRPASASDLPAADTVLRAAFDAFTGVDGLLGDTDYLRSRWRAHPQRVLVSELDGEVVGSNAATVWGKVGWFGPLSVAPRLWDQGLAHRLIGAANDLLVECGATEQGLFTFAHSPKHTSLYARHGYWPGALVLVTARPVPEALPDVPLATYGGRAVTDDDVLLADVTALSSAVHPGLDLADEVAVTSRLGLGDTVLLPDESGLGAAAVCHVGRGTEAGTDTCHIKAALVRPGPGAHRRLTALLDAVDAFASREGARAVTAGVSTARDDCARTLLNRGHRTVIQGVAMHRGGVAHHRAGVWALDDWR